MGNRDVKHNRIATRRFSGQSRVGPNALADQSNARIRQAISLSPGKIVANGSCAEAANSLMMDTHTNWRREIDTFREEAPATSRSRTPSTDEIGRASCRE